MARKKQGEDGGMKTVKAHPLTDTEMRKILGPTKILTSRDLVNITRPDDLFDRQGRCILLYTPYDPTSGHWTCLLRKNDHIEFFDSYGEKPDSPEYLGDQEPLLTQLLKASGMPVYYNTRQFQKDRSDVATCGRWVCARLLYFPYSIDKFSSIVDKFKGEPDSFVSGLIYGMINA